MVGGSRLVPNEAAEISASDPVRIGSLVLLFQWDEGRIETANKISAVTRSPAMVKLYEMVDRVAPAKINILLNGETGVGKEVLAEAIHVRSPRSAKPFIKLNCGGFSETLLESELFGHERGSFTGAAQTKPGLLESAEGGTVLLDEIGELPMSLQVKLLRVLEERAVRRVGGLVARPIDVRFVAATHRDLEAEVIRGSFRQDLFFRLNGITLNIPPLRERVDEIEALAELFLTRFSTQEKSDRPVTLSPEARKLLLRYRWPGNVRELRNVMERAALLVRGNVITRDELPIAKMEADAATEPSVVVGSEEIPAAAMPLGNQERLSVPAARESSDGAPLSWSLRNKTNALERQTIVDALEQCAGNQTKAANLLGISRGTLVARLSLYGLPRPRTRGGGAGSDSE
jgi:DNA-binding NtrC family response regulator